MTTYTFKLAMPTQGIDPRDSANVLCTVTYDDQTYCARLHPAIRGTQIQLEVEAAVKRLVSNPALQRAELAGKVPSTKNGYVCR